MMSHGTHVLVVDDNADLVAVIRRVLSAEGYRVSTAAGGVEALKLFQRERFDVVLTDLSMPGLDGQELVARIKAAAPQTVTILITGYASVSSAIEAIRAGCDDYLLKPVGDLAGLGRTIERCLARRATLARFLQGCRFEAVAEEDVRELCRGRGETVDSSVLGSMARSGETSGVDASVTGPAGSPARNLLIVDPDGDFRDLLAWVFIERGYEVAAVGWGLQALDMLAEEDFDAVVMECRLPDVDGGEALQRMRSARPDLAVIMVSSYVGCLEARRMRYLGAVEIVPKPVRLASLLDGIERAVENKAARQSAGGPQPVLDAAVSRTANVLPAEVR